MSTPTPPGWYADPDDPAFLRFFDGTSWTTGRAPAERLAEAAPPAPDGPPAPAASPAPPAAPVAPAEAPEPGPPGASTGILEPGPVDPTTDIPGPGPIGTTTRIPAPGPVGPTTGRPAHGAMPPPPGGYPPPPPVGGATPARTNNSGLLIGGGVVLAALLAAGGFLVLRNDEPALRWQGQAIAEPDTTLEDAEGVLDSLVDERHGALSDDSRCYFSLPQDEDVKDVNDHVRCGPVLFVDGDASEPYLSFPLTASGGEGEGDLRLAVGDQPVEPEPTALDTGERLVRPDDQQAPEGSGDLEPPEPPPAADDLLEAVDLGPTSTGTPPEGASIGSLNASYELTELATIDRYGVGDSARRPADDHQLIAFNFSQGPGEGLAATGVPAVEVQIDDETPRDVADLIDGGDTVVVSAPEDAESVDLVVTDAEVQQRLSLLDGTPAAGNLRVLTRTNKTQTVGAVHQVAATGTDAVGSVPVTGTIKVSSVHLGWFLQEDPTKRAANGDVALLVPVLDYNWVEITPPDAGLSQEAFTLTLPDGRTLPAFNLAPDPVNEAIIVFEVPADFTTGTLNIGGIVPQPGGVAVDFGANVYQTPINVPAG